MPTARITALLAVSTAALALGGPAPAAPAQGPPTAPSAARLAVPAQTALVRRDRASIEVRCLAPPGAGCHGTVELRVRLAGPALGGARVDLAGGERGRVRLTLRRGAAAIAEVAAVDTGGAVVVARFRADGVPAITAGAVRLR